MRTAAATLALLSAWLALPAQADPTGPPGLLLQLDKPPTRAEWELVLGQPRDRVPKPWVTLISAERQEWLRNQLDLLEAVEADLDVAEALAEARAQVIATQAAECQVRVEKERYEGLLWKERALRPKKYRTLWLVTVGVLGGIVIHETMD